MLYIKSCYTKCIYKLVQLSFHMGLFHMAKTATILAAMLLLVALVDGLSYAWRRGLTR